MIYQDKGNKPKKKFDNIANAAKAFMTRRHEDMLSPDEFLARNSQDQNVLYGGSESGGVSGETSPDRGNPGIHQENYLAPPTVDGGFQQLGGKTYFQDPVINGGGFRNPEISQVENTASEGYREPYGNPANRLIFNKTPRPEEDLGERPPLSKWEKSNKKAQAILSGLGLLSQYMNTYQQRKGFEKGLTVSDEVPDYVSSTINAMKGIDDDASERYQIARKQAWQADLKDAELENQRIASEFKVGVDDRRRAEDMEFRANEGEKNREHQKDMNADRAKLASEAEARRLRNSKNLFDYKRVSGREKEKTDADNQIAVFNMIERDKNLKIAQINRSEMFPEEKKEAIAELENKAIELQQEYSADNKTAWGTGMLARGRQYQEQIKQHQAVLSEIDDIFRNSKPNDIENFISDPKVRSKVRTALEFQDPDVTPQEVLQAIQSAYNATHKSNDAALTDLEKESRERQRAAVTPEIYNKVNGEALEFLELSDSERNQYENIESPADQSKYLYKKLKESKNQEKNKKFLR